MAQACVCLINLIHLPSNYRPSFYGVSICQYLFYIHNFRQDKCSLQVLVSCVQPFCLRPLTARRPALFCTSPLQNATTQRLMSFSLNSLLDTTNTIMTISYSWRTSVSCRSSSSQCLQQLSWYLLSRALAGTMHILTQLGSQGFTCA